MIRSLVSYAIPMAVLAGVLAIGWLAGGAIVWVAAGIVLSLMTAALLAQRQTRDVQMVRAVLQSQRSTESDTQLTSPAGELGMLYREASRFAHGAERRGADSNEQIQQQAQLLDRMNEGLMRVTSDGLVSYANVAAVALFGGRNPAGRSFIGVTRDHELNAALRACLMTGMEQRHVFEIAGEGRIVEAAIVMLNQTPAEALVMLRDITEINLLLNLRRDFVANVSHELRTPLSTIKILTETLIDIRQDDDEGLRFLSKIDAEVDSMTALVRDLLDLTKLESAGGRLAFRNVDTRRLVEDVCDRMRPLARRHAVTINVCVNDGLGMIAVDERRMHQALINLITNAIAHTSAGGRVTVGAEAMNGQIAFEVTDNGSGIPAEDLQRVWERFFKTDRARTGPGTGLGLAIVKHIAQAHGGNVSATSEVGVGSTFRIMIPRGTVGPARIEPKANEIYVPG